MGTWSSFKKSCNFIKKWPNLPRLKRGEMGECVIYYMVQCTLARLASFKNCHYIY